MSLARYQQTGDLAGVAEKVTEIFGGAPVIIDLEVSEHYQCNDANTLLSPADDFEDWRKFVGTIPAAVPCALLPAGTQSRVIVRQILRMEKRFGAVVIRSRRPSDDLSLLRTALLSVDSVDNLLIVLDYGYVKSRSSIIAPEAINVISALRDVAPHAHIVLLGSSYPKSASAYGDAKGTLEIEERTLHQLVVTEVEASYGDYCSIHPVAFAPQKSRYVPRIDYSLPDAWIFRRRREGSEDDEGGWPKCAKEIVALPEWAPELVDENWGAKKIDEAARGSMSGMGTPGPWIAVRVNLHIWQQLRYDSGGDDEES